MDQLTSRNGPVVSSGLDPLALPDAELLILGSFPGAVSLAKGRYYANPRNQFWLLLGIALGVDLAGLEYEARIGLLRRKRIALWDVVAKAPRKNSLDSQLKPAMQSDVPGLVARLPRLRAIAYNGSVAARLGRAMTLPQEIETIVLPSSSPANIMPLERKQPGWNLLAQYVWPDGDRMRDY